MRAISLHQIIAPEVAPVELVRIAATLDCRHVCLFTQAPAGGSRFSSVSDEEMANLQLVMAEHGITAYGITSFAIQADADVAAYEAGLERGARLGAQFASTRIADPDWPAASEAFARFAELAQRYGIMASIECTGFQTPDIVPRTLRIIDEAGAGALTIDPLHIVRTGVSLDVLRNAGPSRIGYVQLCDGPLAASEAQYWHEAGSERLPPGEGEFPLDRILALAPAGRPVSLEVPSERARAAGIAPAERAARAVDATRRLLALVEGS